MKYFLRLTSVLFCISCLYGQNVSEGGLQSNKQLELQTLLGYNFNGEGDWSNLAPDVFLGWNENILGDEGDFFRLHLQTGPTISSPGNIRDTSNYFRAIMLPGNASYSIILYPSLEFSDFKIIIPTIAVGAKVLSGLKDTSIVIAQENIRFGVGFQWRKLISATIQYSVGDHNLTTQSEKNYKKVFKQNSTAVKYLMVNIQSFLTPLNLYLCASWRSLLNASDFNGFDGDRKIVTIGIRKEIDMLAALATAVQ